MKSSVPRPRRPALAAVTAGLTALFLSGCGQEPPPKPVATPAPQAAAKPAPDRPAAESAQGAADRALAARVKSALAADSSINAHRIDIVVKDGAVTLFGTSDTREQRERAGKVAAALAGVQSVENKLAIVAGS